MACSRLPRRLHQLCGKEKAQAQNRTGWPAPAVVSAAPKKNMLP
jgi:hypothetical protein